MNFALKVLFHLLPVIPLALGYYYLLVAFILTVAITYIKTFKLSSELSTLKKLDSHESEIVAKDSDYIAATEKALRFWKSFTFLS